MQKSLVRGLLAGSALSVPPHGAYTIEGLRSLPEGVDYRLRTRNDEGLVDIVVGGDISCLMHIEGGLRRRGSPVRVRHIAEILAGEAGT